jgi:hypothetical protein
MLEPADHEAREWLNRAAGRLDEGGRMPKRDAGDVRQAPELRILHAWIEAQLAESLSATMAQFESAWLRIQADIARQDHDLGRYLPEDCDPKLRQLFALPSNQAQAVLLGHRDEGGAYVAGLADLRSTEFDALMLWLEPVEVHDVYGHVGLRLREIREIARDMTASQARRKFGRRAWLAETTVERYLAEARRKVRRLFGVAA